MQNIRYLDEKAIVFIQSTLFIVLLGSLTAFDPLSIDMYLPAFPAIQKDLLTDYSMVQLSLSSFFIGMSLGQLIYGPLADRWGRKRPLLVGMTLFLMATILCGFAQDIKVLIAMRVLQAFGGCAGMVITRAIVRDVFDSKKMVNFFSSLALVMGLAPILAPTLGGLILVFLNWRYIFFSLAVLNFLCLIFILFKIPETHPQPDKELSFKKVFSTYKDLLKDRDFVGYSLPDSFVRAGMFAYIAASPFVFMEIYHIPTKYYGWLFGANAFGLIVCSQLNRILIQKMSSDQILRKVRPMTFMAASCLLILPMIWDSVFFVIGPLFFYLCTLGLIGPNSGALVLSKQGHRAGMASAMFGTIQWMAAMFTSFLVSHFHNGSIYPMTITMFLCAAVSWGGSYFLINKKSKLSESQI